jgi:glycerol-3-phosphate dehydrogenase
MAERVVDLVERGLERNEAVRRPHAHPVTTEHIPLASSSSLTGNLKEEAARAANEFGVPVATAEHLIGTYGGNYKRLLEITSESEDLKRALTRDLPHIEAEVVYAARYEMAATVDDFLARRTRIALIAHDGGRSCAMRVATLMGRELGWSKSEAQEALAGFSA